MEQARATDRRADRRAAGYRTLALRALDRLSAGHTDPKIVHRLRTSLRRVEAYLELAGEEERACLIAKRVSCLSSLRTLQVFAGYLKRQGAPKSDAKKIRERIRRRLVKLARMRTFEKIRRGVRRDGLVSVPGSPAWLTDRLVALRREHAGTLHDLIAKATAKPRRRTLHALRLKIKSIRYQEEWALSRHAGKAAPVERLKQIQSVLGHYEELAEFRKLARRFDLKSSRSITKDWRRARRRARAIPQQLTDLIEDLAGRRLWLIPRTSPHRLTITPSSKTGSPRQDLRRGLNQPSL